MTAIEMKYRWHRFWVKFFHELSGRAGVQHERHYDKMCRLYDNLIAAKRVNH